jgi:hypothetical protein
MFTLTFHVATMEANALIPLFTSTLDVEKKKQCKKWCKFSKTHFDINETLFAT